MINLIHIITVYKYAFFVPIAVVESNGLSVVSGVLGRIGVVDPFVAGLIIALTNLTGDVVLYWLGFHKGMRVAERWGKYLSVTPEMVDRIKSIFHDHKSKILFISKITNGLGLAAVVLFTAGLSRIPFGTYMFWNVIGEILWTSFLVLMGYVFSHFYLTIDNVIARVSIIGGGLVIIIAAWRFNKYLRNKLTQ